MDPSKVVEYRMLSERTGPDQSCSTCGWLRQISVIGGVNWLADSPWRRRLLWNVGHWVAGGGISSMTIVPVPDAVMSREDVPVTVVGCSVSCGGPAGTSTWTTIVALRKPVTTCVAGIHRRRDGHADHDPDRRTGVQWARVRDPVAVRVRERRRAVRLEQRGRPAMGAQGHGRVERVGTRDADVRHGHRVVHGRVR